MGGEGGVCAVVMMMNESGSKGVLLTLLDSIVAIATFPIKRCV